MNPGGLLLLTVVATILGVASAHRAPRVWLGSSLVAAAAALVAAVLVLAGGATWEWNPDFPVGGEEVHLRLDALSAFFLALLAVLGGTCSAYSHTYWSDAAHPRSARSGRAWLTALLAFMGFVLLSANGLHFLIGWELYTVAAYFLITRERQKREVRAAGWLYLVFRWITHA